MYMCMLHVTYLQSGLCSLDSAVCILKHPRPASAVRRDRTRDATVAVWDCALTSVVCALDVDCGECQRGLERGADFSRLFGPYLPRPSRSPSVSRLTQSRLNLKQARMRTQ